MIPVMFHTIKRKKGQVLVSFEHTDRSHSREGGNPLSKSLEIRDQGKWISAFAGMTTLQEGFRKANDTSTKGQEDQGLTTR